MTHSTTWDIHRALPTTNGLNGMCWQVRSKHTKALRYENKMQAMSWLNLLARQNVRPAGKVTVLFTRIGKKCDKDDNLRGAFKAAKDGIAEAFGIDDGDARWVWLYDQRTKKKADRATGTVMVWFSPHPGEKVN